MSDLFIGIDSGTQGSKVLIVDRKQRAILAEAYAPHEIIEDSHGKREQEPKWWIDAISSAMISVFTKGNLNP